MEDIILQLAAATPMRTLPVYFVKKSFRIVVSTTSELTPSTLGQLARFSVLYNKPPIHCMTHTRLSSFEFAWIRQNEL